MIRRKVNKVSLVGGEGKADRLFLRYFKDQIWNKENGHVIRIHHNISDGGSTLDTIKDVMKGCCNQGRNYDALIVVLDLDIAPSTNPNELYSAIQVTICLIFLRHDENAI